jgi:hypothetical protein
MKGKRKGDAVFAQQTDDNHNHHNNNKRCVHRIIINVSTRLFSIVLSIFFLPTGTGNFRHRMRSAKSNCNLLKVLPPVTYTEGIPE